MTTLQASPKALSTEEATQRLLDKRSKIVSDSPLKTALSKKRKPWMDESIKEVVGYSDRRRKLEDRGILPKLTEDEIAAAVERYRQQEYQSSEPTHERMQKGDVRRTVVKSEGVRFRPRQDVVQRYEGKWSPISELAFKRLMEDAKAADVTGVTIDYHRSGIRTDGGRVGGLNTEQLRKIEAYERFDYVFSRLPRSCRRLCEWLLLGEKLEATGEAPTLADCGRYLFGAITDKRSAEMIGLGAMVITGESLAAIYSQHQMEQRYKEAYVANARTVNP